MTLPLVEKDVGGFVQEEVFQPGLAGSEVGRGRASRAEGACA